MKTFAATTTSVCAVLIAIPALAAARPAPPSDPCITPSVVTEATFPSMVFTKAIQVSPSVYEARTFFADATGKCAKQVGTWPNPVNLRYNPDAKLALVLSTSGYSIVVMVSSIAFVNGPVAETLSEPIPILDTASIPLPGDVPTDWHFGRPESVRISPDGSQLLMKGTFAADSGDGAGYGPSVVTCSLSYREDSMIEDIDPTTCREVHRFTPHALWHEIIAWGALPGTIYWTGPSSGDPFTNSLYRLTVQPPPLPGESPTPSVPVELFHNGGIFMGARANLAPPDQSGVTNGEIVAVYEHSPPGGTRCAKVIVIDAYSCGGPDDLSCNIVNEKGMRSITWLPDGRLAGRGQTPPKKGNGTCLDHESFVAYPAIDPNNKATPTILTTAPSDGYNPCRTCIEGSGGSW